jgi:hypothetical protein
MENLFITFLEIIIGNIKEETKKDKEKVERIWI